MLKQDPQHIRGVLARAELLHSQERVQQAVQDMASAISDLLQDLDPLVLCVMNGGMLPVALLLMHMHFPLRLGYLHATRYRGTTQGDILDWFSTPNWSVAGQHVLLIDDIFDAGITLESVVQHCQTANASSVHSAVLVEKLRPRTCQYRPDFIGLTVADRYVFGMGMDYKNYLRNLPEIYAAAASDLNA